MATRQTNPTGYTKQPDLGPLFSPQMHTDAHRSESVSISAPSVANTPLSTSTEIAARIASERYRRILRSIEKSGPSALFELCDRFDVTPNQISGRLTELKRMMLLAVVGQKPHPKSKAACEVLDLTAAGRQALKEGKVL